MTRVKSINYLIIQSTSQSPQANRQGKEKFITCQRVQWTLSVTTCHTTINSQINTKKERKECKHWVGEYATSKVAAIDSSSSCSFFNPCSLCPIHPTLALLARVGRPLVCGRKGGRHGRWEWRWCHGGDERWKMRARVSNCHSIPKMIS